MKILVTGAAGFIGLHVAQTLLARGDHVLGIDNLNDYYAPQLKHDRLALLLPHPNFHFERVDVADPEALSGASRSSASCTWRRRPACATRSRNRWSTARATSWAS
jgi:nucleoside-diphosphate-sugar epimerase